MLIGIDVGGTFTDLVAVDDEGRLLHAKVRSTPADQSAGVMAGLEDLARQLALELPALLARTERIVHGTTVATNALLERRGARVGLLTTEGHRDVLEMREGLKDDRYDLRQPPPEPLVPRDRRLGVRERIRADGRIEIPLDSDSLHAAIDRLRAERVESIAVCYLHAYRDDRHERATAEAVRAALPEAHLSLSSEVFPEIKELERVSTTVVNAYVGPALERYLRRLQGRLGESGYRGPVLVMQSHGGVATIDDAVRLAAGGVLSGPAGGVAASCHAARMLGVDALLPFDMGGTSTDVSLVQDGRAAIAADRRFAGQRIALQSLDIVSVGAGGGSIARVDAGGVLHVGPQSAGADPGPACYGQGGTDATVTDANLVLGYLSAEAFLGGTAALDVAAAEAAVDRVAAALGVDRMDAADGIRRVVDTRMAEGIRLVSVRRGVDPRRFAILAFGGAAGLHVTEIARQLEIGRVIVPRLASVLSAFGMLASDLRYEVARTRIAEAGRLEAGELRELYALLERLGRRRLAEAGFEGPVRVLRAADMRYGEQIFEIKVDLDDIDWQAPDLLEAIGEAFHRRHEALYTYALRDREGVLVNARLAAVGALPAVPVEARGPARASAAAQGERRVWLGGWRRVPVWALEALAPEQTVAGPAVIEAPTTTVVLRPGDGARATAEGWLDVTVAGATRAGTACPRDAL
jgi:N-methylhydantoinase A